MRTHAMVRMLVNIDVDDLDGAVEFYRRAFGLRPGRRLFDGQAVEMLGAPSPLYLILRPPGSIPSPGSAATRDYARHWTPVHLDFAVGDLEAAIERSRSAGATSEGGVREFEWGRIASMSDPFGHGFCLIQFSAIGYDAAQDVAAARATRQPQR